MTTDLESKKMIWEMKDELASLRATVLVLKAVAAGLLSKDAPEVGLGYIEQLEAKARAADTSAPSRRQLLDVLDALQKLSERGSTSERPDS